MHISLLKEKITITGAGDNAAARQADSVKVYHLKIVLHSLIS